MLLDVAHLGRSQYTLSGWLIQQRRLESHLPLDQPPYLALGLQLPQHQVVVSPHTPLNSLAVCVDGKLSLLHSMPCSIFHATHATTHPLCTFPVEVKTNERRPTDPPTHES